MRKNALLPILGVLLASIMLLSYAEDPPDGRTGAPFDGHCNNCHSSGNANGYNGQVEILGLPDTILPSTAYMLRFKVTPTAGNPIKTGFQLVIVDKNNHNAGYFTLLDAETGTDLWKGREYIENRGGKNFNAAPVEWRFRWTSPTVADCNTIKIYYIVNYCNGSGSDFGDFPIAYADSLYFAGAPSLATSTSTLQNNICPQDSSGIVQTQTTGGAPPYQYHWSNGATGPIAIALANGTYSVTIQDDHLCAVKDSAVVSAYDSISPQINCPTSLYACAQDTVQYALPDLLDNCDPAAINLALLAGLPTNTVFPVGATVQVFQATDVLGNSATCTFTIYVHSRPVVTLDSLLNDAGMAGMGSIFATVTTGSDGAVTYEWTKDGVFFASGSADISGLFAGVYSLEVRDSQGCAAELGPLIIENTVGLNDAADESASFLIAPQPVCNDFFYITSRKTAPCAIQLINAQAQTIRTFSAESWPGPYFTGDLSAGFYVVKIIPQHGNSQVNKLIKTR